MRSMRCRLRDGLSVKPACAVGSDHGMLLTVSKRISPILFVCTDIHESLGKKELKAALGLRI